MCILVSSTASSDGSVFHIEKEATKPHHVCPSDATRHRVVDCTLFLHLKREVLLP